MRRRRYRGSPRCLRYGRVHAAANTRLAILNPAGRQSWSTDAALVGDAGGGGPRSRTDSLCACALASGTSPGGGGLGASVTLFPDDVRDRTEQRGNVCRL